MKYKYSLISRHSMEVIIIIITTQSTSTKQPNLSSFLSVHFLLSDFISVTEQSFENDKNTRTKTLQSRCISPPSSFLLSSPPPPWPFPPILRTKAISRSVLLQTLSPALQKEMVPSYPTQSPLENPSPMALGAALCRIQSTSHSWVRQTLRISLALLLAQMHSTLSSASRQSSTAEMK